jgi:hypothetical protein
MMLNAADSCQSADKTWFSQCMVYFQLENAKSGNIFILRPFHSKRVGIFFMDKECHSLPSFDCCVATDCVTEMIDGMVETFQGLQRLDGFPEVRSVQESCF